MLTHKPIILSLIILILLPSDSNTRADRDFNFNTTVKINASLHLQHPKIHSFINESYTLNKTAIHDTIIRLQNTSVFISSAIVTGSKILTGGTKDYSVYIENSVFEGSEIVIDSASNVTLVYSHFIMDNIGQEDEPNHVVQIFNTGFLFMTDTHFGNQSKQHNQKDAFNSKIIYNTNLGIRLENVSIAELKDCSFTGIKADKSSGSAISLQNTEVLMVSCKLYLNIAENGVILGINSVNITSRNSSFISNYASKSGGVFHLTKSCSLTNDGSVFMSNSAKKLAGVVYATYDVTIINRGCLFKHNSAETGNAGTIYGHNDIKITNIETRYISSTGQMGGAIYIEDHVTCINIQSSFQNNSAADRGGALYGKNDVKLTNYKTSFLRNRVEGNGGAIFIREVGRVTNTDCNFQDNFASNAGAVIYSRVDIEAINTASSFINNTANSGNGGVFTNFDRGKYINTGCIFLTNHAGGAGSVMSFWFGINSENIDCHFTQNTGILKGICETRGTGFGGGSQICKSQ